MAGDVLGRDYYEHGAQPGQGYRNGYRTGRLKTAEGLMEYSVSEIFSPKNGSNLLYGFKVECYARLIAQNPGIMSRSNFKYLSG